MSVLEIILSLVVIGGALIWGVSINMWAQRVRASSEAMEVSLHHIERSLDALAATVAASTPAPTAPTLASTPAPTAPTLASPVAPIDIDPFVE